MLLERYDKKVKKYYLLQLVRVRALLVRLRALLVRVRALLVRVRALLVRVRALLYRFVLPCIEQRFCIIILQLPLIHIIL